MKPVAQPDAASETFYHLRDVAVGERLCQGLACFAARNDAPARWAAARAEAPALFCHGQCHHSPANGNDNAPPPYIEVHARKTVLLGNVLRGGSYSLIDYQQHGGGIALRQLLTTSPTRLLETIAASGLRGRGGAGFPTGRKWQAAAQQPASVKYLVVNADEGDPGSFSDKALMEYDPFLLIEACIIAAYAVNARHGYIYLRQEYPRARAVLEAALAEARRNGWLGQDVPGGRHNFDLELVVGQGSYVCGEETALLNSIEGRRPEVRQRPPQITEHGLFGAPTLVHNVETLCAVPWIIRNGSDAYAALGAGESRGTKLLSLNSLFRRPGLYEVEFGITLRQIVDDLGGGLHRGTLKGVMVGGPLAGLVPPSLLDTPFTYEALHAIGAAVGHGGVIAFADDTSIAELVAEVFRFGALESCGKCTPCHLGSPELARRFAAVVAGQPTDHSRWQDLISALEATSLCGHGRGLAEFARAIERHYPGELAACFMSA